MIRRFLLPVLFLLASLAHGQCFLSSNPVGGAVNPLVQEKKVFRGTLLFDHGFSTRYLSGFSRTNLRLIDHAHFERITVMGAYGLFTGFTVESAIDAFVNKSQCYERSLVPDAPCTNTGGFSHLLLLGRYRLVTRHRRRFYLSAGCGARIPLRRCRAEQDGVVLPENLQPSSRAFAAVVSAALVKEYPVSGWRLFATHRTTINFDSPDGYRRGHDITTALFLSKHLMHPGTTVDWTIIGQLRGDLSTPASLDGSTVPSSGSFVLLGTPQVTVSLRERTDLSLMVDLPLLRWYRGTQLARGYGIGFSCARTFRW